MKKTNANKNILSAQRAKRSAKAKAAFMSSLLTIATMLCTAMTAFAGNGENGTPAGVSTGTMTTLMSIVFWAVRVIVIVIAIPGVIKIVQGQADENPRDRNAGIATVAIAGICFAASFGIEALI